MRLQCRTACCLNCCCLPRLRRVGAPTATAAGLGGVAILKGPFGAPKTVAQAPPYVAPKPAPKTSTGTVGSLPARVVSVWKALPPVAIHPVTGYPIRTAPISAQLQPCQVSTTSKNCGANPSPVSAVGTISPQAQDPIVPGSSAAPKSYTWFYAAAAIVVAIWVFGGLAVIRRIL